MVIRIHGIDSWYGFMVLIGSNNSEDIGFNLW